MTWWAWTIEGVCAYVVFVYLVSLWLRRGSKGKREDQQH